MIFYEVETILLHLKILKIRSILVRKLFSREILRKPFRRSKMAFMFNKAFTANLVE